MNTRSMRRRSLTIAGLEVLQLLSSSWQVVSPAQVGICIPTECSALLMTFSLADVYGSVRQAKNLPYHATARAWRDIINAPGSRPRIQSNWRRDCPNICRRRRVGFLDWEWSVRSENPSGVCDQVPSI